MREEEVEVGEDGPTNGQKGERRNNFSPSLASFLTPQ